MERIALIFSIFALLLTVSLFVGLGIALVVGPEPGFVVAGYFTLASCAFILAVFFAEFVAAIKGGGKNGAA